MFLPRHHCTTYAVRQELSKAAAATTFRNQFREFRLTLILRNATQPTHPDIAAKMLKMRTKHTRRAQQNENIERKQTKKIAHPLRFIMLLRQTDMLNQYFTAFSQYFDAHLSYNHFDRHIANVRIEFHLIQCI